jgi:hypothetical protein
LEKNDEVVEVTNEYKRFKLVVLALKVGGVVSFILLPSLRVLGCGDASATLLSGGIGLIAAGLTLTAPIMPALLVLGGSMYCMDQSEQLLNKSKDYDIYV